MFLAELMTAYIKANKQMGVMLAEKIFPAHKPVTPELPPIKFVLSIDTSGFEEGVKLLRAKITDYQLSCNPYAWSVN